MKTLLYLLLFLIAGNQICIAQKTEWTWAKGAGGSKHDSGSKVATDPAGNVYLTGCFISDTISFGGKTLINSGKGSCDVFIAKFDASGALLWSSSVGGSGDDHGTGICADHNGNAWLTGDFESNAISFEGRILINAGESDVFVARFDQAGNILWAAGAGGKGIEKGLDVTADESGNATITGTFESDAIAFAGQGLMNANNEKTADVFLAHFDASGKVLWTKDIGGSSNESGSSIITDKQGNIFITGVYASPEIKLDQIILTNSTSAGYYGDIFLAKYLPSGQVEWAKTIGGKYFDRGTGISTDAEGNVYLSGWFKSDSINFGCNVLKCTTLSSAENDKVGDVFIAKYLNDGKAIWAKRAGGMARDYGFNVTTGANGEVYLSGVFQPNFNGQGDVALRDITASDIFITKYNSEGDDLWGKSLYGAAMGHNITTDASGNVYLTGVFVSPEMRFSNVILSNSGEGDIFLARMKN